MRARISDGTTLLQGKNTEFLGRVAKLAARRKWAPLISAFRSALRKVVLSASVSYFIFCYFQICLNAGRPSVVSRPLHMVWRSVPCPAAGFACLTSLTMSSDLAPTSESKPAVGWKHKALLMCRLYVAFTSRRLTGLAAKTAVNMSQVEAASGGAAAAADAESSERPQKRQRLRSSAETAAESRDKPSSVLGPALRREWQQFAESLAAAERAAQAAEVGSCCLGARLCAFITRDHKRHLTAVSELTSEVACARHL